MKFHGFHRQNSASSFKAVRVPPSLPHSMAPGVCWAIITCWHGGISHLPPGGWWFIYPRGIHSLVYPENVIEWNDFGSNVIYFFIPLVFFKLFSGFLSNRILNQDRSNAYLRVTPLPQMGLVVWKRGAFTSPPPTRTPTAVFFEGMF